MSYDIYIGKRIQGNARRRVKEETQPDAPAFPNDRLSRHNNGRHPGYRQWSDFCDLVGLTDLFFHPTQGLMRRRPGTFRLRPKHLERVREVMKTWHINHPDTTPGWGPDDWDRPDFQEPVSGTPDPVKARLQWLEWWMRYALDHYGDRAAVHNH